MKATRALIIRLGGSFGLLLLTACFNSAVYSQMADVPAHPLDPLSRDEIRTTVEVLKAAGKTSASSRYSTIVLKEPPKAEVVNFKPGGPLRREAFVVVYERPVNKTFEAVVDVKNRSVLSWREIPGVQPALFVEDALLVSSIVKKDPQWQAAMRKRGISNFQNVQVDPWSAGSFGFPDEEGRRVFRAVSFYRGNGKNPYGRPVEGVYADVDLNAKKIIRLVEAGSAPLAESSELDPASTGQPRTAPKPLVITQPAGASFEIRGHEIRWQNWRFRYALHPREGLVLYTVGYEDQGRVRPVLYRGSLSEMVVPYGSPDEGWFFRNAFDEGEYGIGVMTVSLEAKTDLPDNATVLDAVLASESGGAVEKKGVIGIYERDGGVLWKHVDYMTNKNESRRARQLVLSCFALEGNYDYAFNWVFHQDGTLEMEVLLTGNMAVRGVAAKVEAEHTHGNGNAISYGHLVAPNIEAIHHQHFFNFRLDLDVDGSRNTVVEQNTEALPPGPNNPYHNAFTMKETPLRRELEAQRQLNLASQRRWKVINPTVRNSLGQPTGYLLVTGENSVPYAGPKSSVMQRAAFMTNHLWVTQCAPDEMNAAGFYINQSKGGEGLAKWTKADRPLENQDVVIWYTFGITHIPRPEDWPVMPVHKAGFKLMPNGFFSRNPALDVPK